VISCGDNAVDLQVTDHALDAVALAIHAPVAADFGLAIGFGRNAATDAASCRLARMIGDRYLRKIEKQPNEVQTI
jgi:hypothetical protein